MKQQKKQTNQRDNSTPMPTSKDEIVDMVMDSKLSEVNEWMKSVKGKEYIAANPDITLREAVCTDEVLNTFQKINKLVAKVIEAKAKELKAQQGTPKA